MYIVSSPEVKHFFTLKFPFVMFIKSTGICVYKISVPAHDIIVINYAKINILYNLIAIIYQYNSLTQQGIPFNLQTYQGLTATML